MQKSDLDVISKAFDVLEDVEVMQVFEDKVWIAVDRSAWESFANSPFDVEENDE